MATKVENQSLEALAGLSLESVPPPPNSTTQSSQSPPSKASPNHAARPRREKAFTEIQNVAHRAVPPTAPTTRTSPLVNSLKRSDPFQFGTRYLETTDDVFAWNAWDHVDPSKDEVFVAYAQQQYDFQRQNAASDFDRRRFNAQPEKWWDKFYGNNEANFFKDRKWLRMEFPMIARCTAAPWLGNVPSTEDKEDHDRPNGSDAESLSPGSLNTILEIGAGAGNTVFPILQANVNPSLMVHAVDFSKRAVELLLASEHYNPQHMTASQWDMASNVLPEGVTPGSIDVVLLIFAFSALSPAQWEQSVRNVWNALRPGGEVCFRDYGRGDLAQVRFRKGRLLAENFYVRGDGTRVYFFEEEQLRRIWGGQVDQAARDADSQGIEAEIHEMQDTPDDDRARDAIPSFEVMGLATDRRLLVNRQKQLKMYRCWMQGRFRKPDRSSIDGVTKQGAPTVPNKEVS